MKNYRRLFSLGLLFIAFMVPLIGFSQNEAEVKDNSVPIPSEFDQLIPQHFAFDKEHGIFAAISNIDNTIDIIKHENGNLRLIKKVLVDNFKGRHDVEHVFRAQGVAMYEQYIVFLASEKDSCYFAVMDMEGNLLKKYNFKGNASSFSYSPSKQELYIAGQNDLGYDIIVVETTNGIANIDLDKSASIHYQKARKGEEVAIKDPRGAGLSAVALSIVFLSLLVLTLVFSGYGKALVSIQNLRANLFNKKKRQASGGETPVVKPGNVSGEEYAAIAAAIHLYLNQLHDKETGTLTIKKISRSWTPWNAKYFGMNQYYNRR